ncbi:uncharacterized protein LOC112528597 [Cynara cardunculus var. scolymus]|uniref:uncharacterized protein LOC112528597 n=1 Tax=Cynara cardunculus var. scolymus TaxID=59895 RepID=UPI000D625389|nr:uncharacterized protein LOC112528597 [Cynara cardunculus var. scolymus]
MAQGVCLESLKIMIYITVFSVLLILFIQSLHRKNPTISIEEFYVPTLNKTATGGGNTTTAAVAAATATTNNNTIYFGLKLYNTNVVGLYYRPMNLTFSYFPNKTTNSSVPLGVYPLRGFHQGHYKEKHVRDKVLIGGMTVQPDRGRVVVIRVDLVGRIKFKSIAQWKRTMVVGVDVEVDENTGEKVKKTSINLVRYSAAPAAVAVGWICPAMLLIFLVVSLI